MTRERMVPLPIAARELGWPWHRVYRALLTGQLVSERRGGRWFVTRASVRALQRASAAEPAAPAVAASAVP